jgi:hypothetical protein
LVDDSKLCRLLFAERSIGQLRSAVVTAALARLHRAAMHRTRRR